jgi:hypothetical protein
VNAIMKGRVLSSGFTTGGLSSNAQPHIVSSFVWGVQTGSVSHPVPNRY